MLSSIGRLFKRKQRNQGLETLIKEFMFFNPQSLWFAGPSNEIDGRLELNLTPRYKVEAITKMRWTEAILANSVPIQQYISYFKNHHIPGMTPEDCIARQENLYRNCAIRWLNDEIGWVVTLRPGKMLQKGFVCCYAGMLTEHHRGQPSSYLAREYFLSLIKTDEEEIGVDAKQYGNISRFMPFLLEEKYLENFVIEPSISNRIAVANLQFQFMQIADLKIPCVYAPFDIVAPQDKELLLGLTYSLPYFYKMHQSKKNFKFLDKTTFSSIDSKLYPQKKIKIHLDGVAHSLSLLRLRIITAESLPNLQYHTCGFDQTTQEYYEITVADLDVYHALMQQPEASSVIVKPTITKISYEDYMRKKNKQPDPKINPY